ncbi:MAG: site-specific integrase [Candidatus Nitrospinota bacterium M3_3B_026]
MTAKCRQVLLDLRGERERMAVAPASDHVFIKPDGTRRKPNNVSRAFRKVCVLAGIEDFRFHDLRHELGTRLHKAGVPLADIKDWMGHSDIAMTLRYAHQAGDTALREAARKLEQVRDR